MIVESLFYQEVDIVYLDYLIYFLFAHIQMYYLKYYFDFWENYSYYQLDFVVYYYLYYLVLVFYYYYNYFH